MTLFEKLLGYIHPPVFDKEPHGFIALRLRHTSNSFRWVVSERVLSGFDGGVTLFSIALEDFTLRALISYLQTLDGVSVSNVSTDLDVSAATLIDGAGEQAVSNGDVLYAYTSLLWMYLDVISAELSKAKDSIVAAIDQMSVKSADDDWLDEWGGYFGVGRIEGESDPIYSNRIIAEVLRPRGNNKAIELAILDRFGQESTVTDLTKYKSDTRRYDSEFIHDATINYDATDDPFYGLFSVVISYDLESGADLLAYAAQVREFVEKFRDAGTHLESLSLSSSLMNDSADSALSEGYSLSLSVSVDDALSPPLDDGVGMAVQVDGLADTATPGADSASIDVSFQMTYSGLRKFNGDVAFNGGNVINEAL